MNQPAGTRIPARAAALGSRRSRLGAAAPSLLVWGRSTPGAKHRCSVARTHRRPTSPRMPRRRWTYPKAPDRLAAPSLQPREDGGKTRTKGKVRSPVFFLSLLGSDVGEVEKAGEAKAMARSAEPIPPPRFSLYHCAGHILCSGPGSAALNAIDFAIADSWAPRL